MLVGRSVRWSVGLLVGPSVHLCENVTFRLSNGNLTLSSYLPTVVTVVTVVTKVTIVTVVTKVTVMTIATVETVMTAVTVVTKLICTPQNLNLPKTYLPTYLCDSSDSRSFKKNLYSTATS